MTIRATIVKIAGHEGLNFLLTNRIPRRTLTRFMGWFGRLEQPLIRDASLAVWRLFSDLDLSDASETRFRSLHHCFTRRLRPGARIVEQDPDLLVSPCDAIVGASGRITDGHLFQIKGSPYPLQELLLDAAQAERFRDGLYVTLRLTSSMYHRFHAPGDLRVTSVTHIPGDTWNVNPPALRRVRKLFCRNERALVDVTLAAGAHRIMLVPVAAILVAGIRLSFLNLAGMPRFRQELQVLDCDVPLRRGEEMGWFEHGSTILVLAPAGFQIVPAVSDGQRIRMGQPLMRLPDRALSFL